MSQFTFNQSNVFYLSFLFVLGNIKPCVENLKLNRLKYEFTLKLYKYLADYMNYCVHDIQIKFLCEEKLIKVCILFRINVVFVHLPWINKNIHTSGDAFFRHFPQNVSVSSQKIKYFFFVFTKDRSTIL